MTEVPNEIGKKYLITTSDWFMAPDGEQYSAVFGTVHGIFSADKTLGVETNKDSTNWYVRIGNMTVAGCRVNYAIRTDKVNFEPVNREWDHESRLYVEKQSMTRIYDADK